jgi:hypothetical protein
LPSGYLDEEHPQRSTGDMHDMHSHSIAMT